ncbi:MAG: hypothetical protein QE263_09990 [Vampirovibrionales bacterium]|nr:hypothetical protein [Vampirovibrionales bacterium]
MTLSVTSSNIFPLPDAKLSGTISPVHFSGRSSDSFQSTASVSPKFGGAWTDLKGAWGAITKAATNPADHRVLTAWSQKYVFPNVVRAACLVVPVVGWILLPILNWTWLNKMEKKADGIIQTAAENGGEKALGVNINRVMDGVLDPSKPETFKNVQTGVNNIMDELGKSNVDKKSVFEHFKLEEGKPFFKTAQSFFGLFHYLQGSWFGRAISWAIKGSFKMARGFKPLLPLVVGFNALLALALRKPILRSIEKVAQAAIKA